MNRLIVNIRGANASGKTTLMRKFLDHNIQSTGVRPAPDGTKVDYTVVNVPELNLPVLVIGKYDDSKYSGCDKIKSADAIEWAVRTAVKEHPGHVMFEGFRVSKSYARFAALRNELTKEPGLVWLWAMLHASHDLICERADGRREAGSRPTDRNELAAVVRQMDKTRRTVMQLWSNDVVDLRSEWEPKRVYEHLLNAMITQESVL